MNIGDILTCHQCRKPFEVSELYAQWRTRLEEVREKLNLPERHVCPKCGCMNLARFFEATEPGDTIEDIHNGEQLGAYFRGL